MSDGRRLAARQPVRIVLASASPRRMEMLRQAGFAFRAVPSRVDERPPRRMAPRDYVSWAANAKAEAVVRRYPGRVVVGADTEVVLRGRIFGKPSGAAQAAEFLRALSGRTHHVYTAIEVIDGRTGCKARGISRTHVTMRELSPRMIASYVGTGEAQDKAGAYAIQGEGRRLVSGIEGPYDNVVGMPMRLLRRLLRQCGIPVTITSPDELQHDVHAQGRPSSRRRHRAPGG